MAIKATITRDILAVAPEIPYAYEPKYEIWKKEVERFEIDSDTMLIGHSCGGGVLVRYLSENKDIQVGKVVLVSPSMGLEWEDRSFFEFEIDPDLKSRTEGITIFTSDNDLPTCQKSSKIYADTLGAELISLPNHGHFRFEEMGTEEFPELLKTLVED
ncbi:MAG: alpha/beta hydrolase [Patescibacteria group bacterium]